MVNWRVMFGFIWICLSFFYLINENLIILIRKGSEAYIKSV